MSKNFWIFILWLCFSLGIGSRIPRIGPFVDLIILGLLWYYYFRKKPVPRRDYSQHDARVEGDASLKDPYRILEIDSGAGVEEVKRAYRLQASKYHPDKVAHLGRDIQEFASKRFQEINWAYEKIMERKNG